MHFQLVVFMLSTFTFLDTAFWSHCKQRIADSNRKNLQFGQDIVMTAHTPFSMSFSCYPANCYKHLQQNFFQWIVLSIISISLQAWTSSSAQTWANFPHSCPFQPLKFTLIFHARISGAAQLNLHNGAEAWRLPSPAIVIIYWYNITQHSIKNNLLWISSISMKHWDRERAPKSNTCPSSRCCCSSEMNKLTILRRESALIHCVFIFHASLL